MARSLAKLPSFSPTHMHSIRCHLEYRWPLTGEELSETACQQLCNVSGLSAFIGWPACASGLSCPSISTPIYSLAASAMIFSCDTELFFSSFFSPPSGQQFSITMLHSHKLPRGYCAIMYSHTGINISSHRSSPLPTKTDCYNNFCILTIIKHSIFFFFFCISTMVVFFPPSAACVCVSVSK